MLFTVLGVIALFLRERNINSTVSGQDERLDRQEEGLVTVPPVANSDGREIGDWCEESSLHLEEQINVQTEEPSLEEPVDGQSEEQSLVEPDSVHGEEQSLVEPVSVHGEEQSLVEPVSVHGEEQSLVEPVSVHGEEQSLVEPVSVHGEEQSLVEPDSVHGEEQSLVEPDSVHGEEQSLVEPDSVHGEESSLVEPVDGHSEDSASSSSSDDVPPNIFYAESSSSDDFPQEFSSAGFNCSSELTASSYSSFFSAESGCGDDPSTEFLSAESGCGDDPSTEFLSAESGCGDDPSSDFLSAESGCGDDPPNVVPAKPGCSPFNSPNVVPAKPGCSPFNSPNVVPAKPGCSHFNSPKVVPAKPGCKNVAKGATCQTKGAVPPQPKKQKDKDPHIIEIKSKCYKIGDKLGKGGFGTVFAGTRLQDGLQVAVKIAKFKVKRYIRVEGFDKPLPAEIALHFLANKGLKVKEIVKLLDWKVEADRYIMILERPIAFVSLGEFLKNHSGKIAEDLVRKIMFQATTAAHACCKRKVFHRDIKPDNLLINPETFEIKLIDFGCGELLTEGFYCDYWGTIKYCPPEFKKTGLYYGEPATVWSLGILQYLLMFQKLPEHRDLLKLKNNYFQQYGWSKECSDFITGCLQTTYSYRHKLHALRVHAWFKEENKQ
ncbi:aurora kinase A-like [Danio aesculapii]|uniref:aurora kinase A-like n=1 Tax=Danio aesculapii TaxID=1142201 RepID=UPI0024C05B16|nr:aurora kinase A-like [Danio aesculapii]